MKIGMKNTTKRRTLAHLHNLFSPSNGPSFSGAERTPYLSPPLSIVERTHPRRALPDEEQDGERSTRIHRHRHPNLPHCRPDILFLKHACSILRQSVQFYIDLYFCLCTVQCILSDSHPTLYVVHERSKPVIRGPNSTEPNLFHHGETTYRVG